MKVFLQAQHESIVINGDITVTVLKIEGDEVVLGIDAPQWLSIEESSELQFENSRTPPRCRRDKGPRKNNCARYPWDPYPGIGDTVGSESVSVHRKKGRTRRSILLAFLVLFGA